jgi:hypothetical protein
MGWGAQRKTAGEVLAGGTAAGRSVDGAEVAGQRGLLR